MSEEEIVAALNERIAKLQMERDELHGRADQKQAQMDILMSFRSWVEVQKNKK